MINAPTSFSLSILLVTWGLFPHNPSAQIWVLFPYFCEEWCGDFDWDCPEYVSCFGEDGHFHTLFSLNP